MACVSMETEARNISNNLVSEHTQVSHQFGIRVYTFHIIVLTKKFPSVFSPGVPSP